jgi:hypothetical protein
MRPAGGEQALGDVLVGDLEQLSEALLAHPPRLRARDCHELVALL